MDPASEHRSPWDVAKEHLDKQIEEYDYDWMFVTTQAGKRRLIRLFEAIDSGDVKLYWTDRLAWGEKHGYDYSGTVIKRDKKRLATPKYEREWFKNNPDAKPYSTISEY